MSGNGADDIRRLVQTFITDAQTRMLGLVAAAKSGDADEVRSLAHSLAGSSGNLGALTVAEICDEIASASWAGEALATLRLAESLRAALADAVVELRREFGLTDTGQH